MTKGADAILYRDYFNPNPPEEWDFDSALRAKKMSGALKCKGTLFTLLAGLGSTILAYKLVRIGFTAALLTNPSYILLTITCVAAFALAFKLSSLSAQHSKGLTKEILRQLSFERLKQGLEEMKIIATSEELKETLETAEIGFFRTLYQPVDDSNDLYYQVSAIYNPKTELQPRFKIYSRNLSMEQMQELLAVAYKRGIILEFFEFRHYSLSGEKKPGFVIDVKRDYGKEEERLMHRAFDCSVQFLEQRLLADEELDANRVNTQLNAFGYKWETKAGPVKIMKSPLTIEIEEGKRTVVIRGNCNEIPNPPTDALDRLTPLVDVIKIYRVGISFEHCISDKKWGEFKEALQTRYHEKIEFVGFEQAGGGENSIWQENAIEHDTSLSDIFKDAKSDWDRFRRQQASTSQG